MTISHKPENTTKTNEARPSLGKADKAPRKPKPKCTGGRLEHTMEPEWKGNSFDYLKCRFCGKREAV